jgi:hypothetical protein
MQDLVKRLYEEVKFELCQYAQMDEDGAPVHDSPGQADIQAREALWGLLEALNKHIVRLPWSN